MKKPKRLSSRSAVLGCADSLFTSHYIKIDQAFRQKLEAIRPDWVNIPTKRRWDSASIREESLKYKTRSAFDKGSPGACEAAKRLGILDSVCSHMEIKLRKHSFESIAELAKQYRTKTQFKHEDPGAYTYAYSNGILDQICAHMCSVRGKHGCKRVRNLTTDKTFESAATASRKLGLRSTAVSRAISRGHKVAGSYWEYVTEPKVTRGSENVFKELGKDHKRRLERTRKKQQAPTLR